ncbi:MAG: hypothetical protein HY843_02310, partial [Bdellovibrio sp.]|nr:hypothetical protein [Bdellovibrio sp.]
ALWFSGLGVALVFYQLGFEFMAVFQGVIATLMSLLFIYYGVTLGEKWSMSIHKGVVLVAAGLMSAFLFYFAFQRVLTKFNLISDFFSVRKFVENLHLFSRQVLIESFLSVLLLAIILFVTLIGVGTVSREE